MTTVSKYIDEHKQEAPRLLKHAAPYFVAFWGGIVALIGAGWLDLPARSQDLVSVQTQQTENTSSLKSLGESVRGLEQNDAVQTKQLENIENNISDANSKLDQIIQVLIQGAR